MPDRWTRMSVMAATATACSGSIEVRYQLGSLENDGLAPR
jgi:hypothetical protein